jgi:hypothetical protein
VERREDAPMPDDSGYLPRRPLSRRRFTRREKIAPVPESSPRPRRQYPSVMPKNDRLKAEIEQLREELTRVKQKLDNFLKAHLTRQLREDLTGGVVTAQQAEFIREFFARYIFALMQERMR